MKWRYHWREVIPFFFILGFIVLTWNCLYWHEQDLIAKGPSAYMDWPAHFAYATHVAWNSPTTWFEHSPLFDSAKNTYPFIADIPTGFLIKWNVPLRFAFLIPMWVYFAIFVVVFKKTCEQLELSVFATWTAMGLYIFNGGIGFLKIFSPEVAASSLSRFTFTVLYGNNLLEYLLPARGLLLSLTIFLLLVIFLDKKLKAKNSSARLVSASELAMIFVPIVIYWTYSSTLIPAFALVLTYLIFSWGNRRLFIKIFVFSILSAVLFLLHLKYVTNDHQLNQFVNFNPNWISNAIHEPWIFFYLKEGGLFFVLALWSLTIKDVRKSATLIAGFIILVLFHFVQWFVFYYDNGKVLTVAFLILALAVAKLLENLLMRSRAATISIIILLVIAGALDISKILVPRKLEFKLANESEIELATEFRKLLRNEDLVLTSNKHNHWFYMFTGGRSFLSHPLSPWAYGFDIREALLTQQKIFAGESDALELLKSHRISYVAASEHEDYSLDEQNAHTEFLRKYNPPRTVNFDFFEKNLDLVLNKAGYRIYRTRGSNAK